VSQAILLLFQFQVAKICQPLEKCRAVVGGMVAALALPALLPRKLETVVYLHLIEEFPIFFLYPNARTLMLGNFLSTASKFYSLSNNIRLNFCARA
jgi:hypothetical protein